MTMDKAWKEYYAYKERIMQDNKGLGAAHTFFSIFFTVQCALLMATQPVENKALRYLLEYFTIVVTLINAHSVFVNFIYIFNIILFGLLATKFCFKYKKLNVTKVFNLPNVYMTDKIKSITLIRGLTYLMTVYSICAVDFYDFPKQMAKTKVKGFSFMDTGVGLFALISGVVHKDPKNNNYTAILISNLKIVSILIVLGLVRFFSVKQLDYYVEITEYGVHWNFFFTLAVCKFLTTLLLIFYNKPLVLSISMAFVHQCLLDLGLQVWVFSEDERLDFLSANREGISSLLGYVTLYIFAVHVKYILTDQRVRRKMVFTKLAVSAALLWLSTFFLHTSFRPISRVLANITYITFVSSIFMTVLFVFYVFEVLFQNEKANTVFEVPPIIQGINENGLIFFIIGNILTGIFNMTMFTLFLPSVLAMAIQNFYMIFNISVVLIFNKFGIKV